MLRGLKKLLRPQPTELPEARPAPQKQPEPARIRWVNEDVSQQPKEAPVSPVTHDLPPLKEEVSTTPTFSQNSNTNATRPYGYDRPKAKSAPPVRPLNNSARLAQRPVSAGVKQNKRFVQPTSDFSLHGINNNSDAPLASTSFPFKPTALPTSTTPAPIDPLSAAGTFSQQAHSRVTMDPFTDVSE
eukprot:NODE_6752_length_846_cov_71.372061_g6154_i0.p1 GENE.NODE_6752_length_846_cov_71.372061_g6154_i0~~NODE_6752_length_846_cov_71.372061_g6154_i0.p1  ORF type:complete len:186 (-),score=38.13 NODE_6752_length_846_cov_71.372061_g6154_i0:214-771(-)